MSLAFEFRVGDRLAEGGRRLGKGERVVYISDVSSIPEAVEKHLTCGPQIDLLVLDCLHHGRHFSHFGMA